MVDLDSVGGATEALSRKGTIKSIQASPWKMRPPARVASATLTATIVALQVKPTKAQGHDFAEVVLGFAALGFLTFLWMLWSLVSWLCRRRPAPEPEPEEEAAQEERAATPPPPREAHQGARLWLDPPAPEQEEAAQQPRGAHDPEPEGERTPGPPPVAQPPPAPPAVPRACRRRRGPEPLSGDNEWLYESTRGDKVHLFTNCNGLSSVPAEQILLGHRCVCAADPQGSDFLWKQFEARGGGVEMRYHGQERGCPFMQGPDTFRHRACLHCRNGHQSNKPGSARHNSRRWVPPGP